MSEVTVMATVTTAAVAKVVAPAVSEALKTISPTILSNIGKMARSTADRAIVSLQIGFQEYLTTSYNKCKFFKSILSPQAPLDVLSHYVNVNLSCNGSTISDIDLVNDITNKKRVVVTGLAGSGKSMLMKYFTISHFEAPRGSVPLFVELRHLNSFTDIDLLTFIRSSCTSKSHNVTSPQFELSLRAGAFILILDGFDELNHEIRDEVQKQILSLEKDYPNTPVVISSRPDDRFESWASYYVYSVVALDKTQVTKLIQNLEYDSAVKRRFLKEVANKLFESHESFLSSPLLASIMLLTYEEFAEIPHKMHAFYGQAFDTLFQKHDASKEQYQRKTHTQLAREDFKECFSVFCALGYLEQKFSFSEDDLLSTASIAIKYMKSASDSFPKSVTPKQLIKDLFESVCMLQKDGVEVAFVHRSFQEYFSAIFGRSLKGENLRKFFDRCALRFGDTVIPMAADMAKEVVEGEWVLPTVEQLISELDMDNPTKNMGAKLRVILPGVYFMVSEKNALINTTGFDDAKYGALETLTILYPKHLNNVLLFSPFSKMTLDRLKTTIEGADVNSKTYKAVDALVKRGLELATPAGVNPATSARKAYSPFMLTDQEDWWFERVGMDRIFKALDIGLRNVLKEVIARDKKKDTILLDFLKS